MIGNALLLALVLFMAFGFVLMDRLKFLVPYRQSVFHEYGWAIGLYALLLFGNLFATFFLLARRFFLKHTGQKLDKIEKDVERDFIMNSQQAKEYGIIDDIIDKPRQ